MQQYISNLKNHVDVQKWTGPNFWSYCAFSPPIICHQDFDACIHEEFATKIRETFPKDVHLMTLGKKGHFLTNQFSIPC
jgi:hypothetical protein